MIRVQEGNIFPCGFSKVGMVMSDGSILLVCFHKHLLSLCINFAIVAPSFNKILVSDPIQT